MAFLGPNTLAVAVVTGKTLKAGGRRGRGRGAGETEEKVSYLDAFSEDSSVVQNFGNSVFCFILTRNNYLGNSYFKTGEKLPESYNRRVKNKNKNRNRKGNIYS